MLSSKSNSITTTSDNDEPRLHLHQQAGGTLLGQRPLTLCEQGGLSTDLAQMGDDFFVAVDEPVQGIGHADIGAEILNEPLGASKIMAGHARVEVMDGLKLQAAMDEIEPRRAIDVHRGPEHLLRETLAHPRSAVLMA